MTEPILHHYLVSLFAEKIHAALGVEQLFIGKQAH